jgi:undecaprenyl-phosphate glucose phosphotransferase
MLGNDQRDVERTGADKEKFVLVTLGDSMALLAQQRAADTPFGTIGENVRTLGKQQSLFSLTVAADVLAGIEAVTIFATSIAAKLIYLDLYLSSSLPVLSYASLGLFAGVIGFFIIRNLNLYDLRGFIRTPLRFGRLALALALTFLTIATLLYLLKAGANFSRGWIVLWFALSASGLAIERYWAHKFLRWRAAKGYFKLRVAVCGARHLGQKISAHIKEHPDDFELVGQFGDGWPGSEALGAWVDGDVEALIASGQQSLYDQVIIALPAAETSRICALVNKLSVLPVDIQLFPDVISLPLKIRGTRFIGDLHLLELQQRPLTERGQFLKCSMDCLVSFLALVVLLPLFLILGIAIKLDSPGPVFFRQRRHGFNHRVIRVFKFRTMTVMEDGDVITQAAYADRRVTSIGRLLRRTSLDELPQLINVVRGEMSLVGPRPHALAHNEYYRDVVEHYSTRHRVRPGITGWAQVHGYRGETSNPDHMRNRVKYDIDYIENWSILLDMKILAKTLRIILGAKNAY